MVSIANANVTPMMAQFLQIKEGYKDALLFYRMGDFYEMFFDDAVLASEALDIALTKRGKHLGKDIPMCGVPAHSAENYLLSLIKKGFRVAVCDQLEDPAEAKKRGSKSVVKRDVVRLVTPGTLTEDSLLDASKHNYLAAFSDIRGEAAFAWTDMSTGEIWVMPCPREALSPQLARLSPREVLVSPTEEDPLRGLVEESGAAITPLARSSFDSTNAEKRLCGVFQVSSLDGFGQFGRGEVSALGAIIDYLDLTQKGKLPLLLPPVREVRESSMQIDAATRRNLELSQSLSGGRAGSLLAVVDRTITGPGARLLYKRLNSPSTRLDVVQNRQDSVELFLTNKSLTQDTRNILRKLPDMDRALSRLALDRGGPRDIAAIRAGLEQAHSISELLLKVELPFLLKDAQKSLVGFDDLRSLLEIALVAEPPLLARDGGFVAAGFHQELDEVRKLRDEGRGVIASLQRKYADLSCVSSLKIKFNNVLGYFVETPSSHSKRMLEGENSESFIHRQTTANAIRFTTLELSELETKILNAGGKALTIEKEVFEELRSATLEVAVQIYQAAKSLAEIDLSSALADLAAGDNWCRPIVQSGRAFNIVGGRHPVVEYALKQADGSPFIANDCDLTPVSANEARAWLLTGPNMAGKSTFLRQNALIALLAQMGSFVPATSAEIGVVTQLFSRVGAADDLARGRSTFMVEMVETAAILNQSGPGALVILDEIGRGTATYDGLSIAWATLEHLHDVNKCRTLFATHYHELTALSSRLEGASNATVAVKEWDGEVVFLHEVHLGAADRSYGVQVARLAGLPDLVVERARAVLEQLEKGERESGKKPIDLFDDLPLFSAPPAAATPTHRESSELEDKLKSAHPDEMSPLDALRFVYELRELLKD